MWPVLAQSHPWTNVPSVDGASTTVHILKMQEWCAKVRSYVCVRILGRHVHVCPVYFVLLYCIYMHGACVHGVYVCIMSTAYCVYRECVYSE